MIEMAVTIHSGELRHQITFKEPVSSLNNQAGRELTYPTDTLTAMARVDKFNQYRATEAEVTALTGALDFYVRHSEAREAIDKEWLIVFNAKEYTIHAIEPVEQRQRFIRFTGKTRV